MVTETHWVISGFRLGSIWVSVRLVLGLFSITQTKGSHYSTTPLLHYSKKKEGYHPLAPMLGAGVYS